MSEGWSIFLGTIGLLTGVLASAGIGIYLSYRWRDTWLATSDRGFWTQLLAIIFSLGITMAAAAAHFYVILYPGILVFACVLAYMIWNANPPSVQKN